MCTRQLVVNHRRLPLTGTNSSFFVLLHEVRRPRGNIPRHRWSGVASLLDAGIPLAGTLNPGNLILTDSDDRKKKYSKGAVFTALSLTLMGFFVAICELHHKRKGHRLFVHCLFRRHPSFARWGFLHQRGVNHADGPITSYSSSRSLIGSQVQWRPWWPLLEMLAGRQRDQETLAHLTEGVLRKWLAPEQIAVRPAQFLDVGFQP